LAQGLRVHERKAAYWLLQAAKQGHENAALLLGVRYMQGQGTRKDYDQGIKWVRKSSHWGCQDASNLLDAISNGTQPDKVTTLCILPDIEAIGPDFALI
jgi:TPR repeat protein